MCLTISNLTKERAIKLARDYKTAKEDIIVYKVLRFTREKFESPYQGYVWEKGQHHFQTDGKLGTRIYKSLWSSNGKLSIDVNQGLHAYTHKNVAISSAQWMDGKNSLRIVELVIPKGAKYLKSKADKEIVATEMIFFDDAVIEKYTDLLKLIK